MYGMICMICNEIRELRARSRHFARWCIRLHRFLLRGMSTISILLWAEHEHEHDHDHVTPLPSFVRSVTPSDILHLYNTHLPDCFARFMAPLTSVLHILYIDARGLRLSQSHKAAKAAFKTPCDQVYAVLAPHR